METRKPRGCSLAPECTPQVARPDNLARLSWATAALCGDGAAAASSGRFPSPQQETLSALLSRLCAHFAAPSAGGSAAAEAPPAGPGAIGALWEEVRRAMAPLFVPLAESVVEAVARAGKQQQQKQRGGADLRARAQQFGDALTFFVLNAPPGAGRPRCPHALAPPRGRDRRLPRVVHFLQRRGARADPHAPPQARRPAPSSSGRGLSAPP